MKLYLYTKPVNQEEHRIEATGTNDELVAAVPVSEAAAETGFKSPSAL